MRHFGTFVSTAIAAVTAMALIGASSASATRSTAVCNEASAALACPATKLATALHGVATNPLWHTNIVTFKCDSSLFKAKVGALGNPQIATLEELTWTGCETHSGSKCTVLTLLKGTFKILKLSTTDAHVTLSGTTTLIECGIFIHCSYGGDRVLLAEAATGNSPADLKANTVITSDPVHTSGLCPNTATWLALYTNLANVYIRS